MHVCTAAFAKHRQVSHSHARTGQRIAVRFAQAGPRISMRRVQGQSCLCARVCGRTRSSTYLGRAPARGEEQRAVHLFAGPRPRRIEGGRRRSGGIGKEQADSKSQHLDGVIECKIKGSAYCSKVFFFFRLLIDSSWPVVCVVCACAFGVRGWWGWVVKSTYRVPQPEGGKN